MKHWIVIVVFAATACSGSKKEAAQEEPSDETASERAQPADESDEAAEPATGPSAEATPPGKTFLDWCKDPSSPPAIRKTIKELERVAYSDDCDAAWKALRDESDLHLYQLSDLRPLAGMTQVASLRIDGNGVEDLAPLAGMTKLTELELRDHAIKDLRPLAGLTELETLDVSYNEELSDVSPLASLPKLTWLGIIDTSVEDTSALAGKKDLEIETEEEESVSSGDED